MEMHEKSVVKVDRNMGMIVLLLNIFFSGIGTIVAGVLVGGTFQIINNIIVGFLQLILFPYLLLGWFWSLYTGYLIYKKSKEP